MKDLLIMQTLAVFENDPEMSLLSSLHQLTQQEAEWQFNATNMDHRKNPLPRCVLQDRLLATLYQR